MKIQWNKVTWYSKLIAAFAFALTFLVGYWLGGLTQKTTDDYAYSTTPVVITPYVTSTRDSGASPAVGLGGRCGGNMVNPPVCGNGYHCAPVPGSHLPFGDVGGVCVLNQ